MANWNDYTEITTPADADTFLEHDVSETTVGQKMKRVTWANIKATLKTYFDTLYLALVAPGDSGNVLTSNGTSWTSAAPVGGGGDWTDATGTWSYSSADAPTFVASVNADMTTTIYPGQRLSLTQTTEKFFIVTAVGSYSGGNTLITMYGGTDYTLANEAITSPKWSNVKVPSRFPMSPTKWTVTATDTTSRTQADPTTDQWYNLGSLGISVPIGLWNARYSVTLQGTKDSAGALGPKCTLSTANNSESDNRFTCVGSMSDIVSVTTTVSQSALITAASKTAYYLNAATTAGGAGSDIYFRNDKAPMFINLVCAYL